MPPSKEYLQLIEKMKEIHLKKNADYANDTEPLQNFTIAAELVKHFKNPVDQVFVSLIGVKLARLSVLLNHDRPPQNEPVMDTFVDGPNYFALWGAYRMMMEKSTEEIPSIGDLHPKKYPPGTFVPID